MSAYRQQDIKTKVLAASMRHPMHIQQAALAGADIATLPFSVLKQLFNHPLTDAGQKKFLEDYRKTQEAEAGEEQRRGRRQALTARHSVARADPLLHDRGITGCPLGA